MEPAEIQTGQDLVCRRCQMKASLSMIWALLDDKAHGVARCFCGCIEWDFAQ